MWERLRVTFWSLWGSERYKGSLSHLKDIGNRRHADRGVKTFNVCDELLRHASQAHLLAAVTSHLNVATPSNPIACDHELTNSWRLRDVAERIASSTVLPKEPDIHLKNDDQVCLMHRRVLHLGFLHELLRDSVRKENGPLVIILWRLWLPMFLGSGRKNYSVEAANLLANLKADWSSSMAFIHTHNRSVNMSGKETVAKLWIT